MKTFTGIADAKKETGLSYLGNVNISSKMIKNKKVSNQFTYIIYLSPAELSGYNVCSHSTPECRIGCLNTSGRAKMETNMEVKTITNARLTKTKLFFEDQNFFMQWLVSEIMSNQAKAAKKGFGFSVRLNGTSDIDWANVKLCGQNIFEIFPEVQFYDYTKNPSKFNEKPANYHLTFSFSGRNGDIAEKLLNKGFNVAVVFNTKKGLALPKTFMGYKVIDGDLTDYRPNDGQHVIVGLRFKEIASKTDAAATKKSIFVVDPNVQNLSLAF
jgi:hypothetical protein